MKKKKEKKIRNFFVIIIILLIIGITGFAIFNSVFSSVSDVKKIKTIDNISKYDYTLRNNSNKYYKNLFKELKEILDKDEVNDEEYAKKITQLFVTDLFTLSNKITSSDIGGVQFVYKSFQDNYISIAQNGLYSSIKSDIYGDRKQELPEVSEVTIKDIKIDNFSIGDKKYENSYYITTEIKYKKDLDYPSKYEVVLIKNDKKIEVVKSNESK